MIAFIGCIPHGQKAKRSNDTEVILLDFNRTVYLRRARRELLSQLIENGEAMEDAVRRAVTLPAGIKPAAADEIDNPLIKAGIIKCVALSIERQHNSPQRLVLWRLLDRVAASSWLRAHCELSYLTFAANLLLLRPEELARQARGTDKPKSNH